MGEISIVILPIKIIVYLELPHVFTVPPFGIEIIQLALELIYICRACLEEISPDKARVKRRRRTPV